MSKYLKPLIKKRILILATLPLLVIVFSWRQQRIAPRKPDYIPLVDYTYTVDYSEHRIQQLMKHSHLPSVAIALIDDQDIVWQEAFGLANIEEEILATTDTAYKLWSVAKVFTAIETMRLVEEGLIDLDAPITDYLPDFSIQSRFPDVEPITIRHILTHHAGLPRNGCHSVDWYDGNDVLDEKVASLSNCYMAFPAGYRYKYSNIGPDALGAIIQNTRNKPFPYYMEENLLTAIGMKNSAFLTADIPSQKEVALGYEFYEGEYYPLEQGDITSLPSGNLYATIEDMSEFAKFIFRGGEANGGQIIKAETLDLMFEDQYSSHQNSQPMGLGWKTARVLGDELLVWHDGGPTEGVGSLVALLPERKLGVVLFANEISFEGNVSVSLAIDILELMLETKYGIASPEKEPPKLVDIAQSQLDNYAGKYIIFGKVMDISSSKNGLKGSIQGMKFNLIPVSQTEFRLSHWLLNLGLEDLLQLPMELQELEIEFLLGDKTEEKVMIVNFGNISYEVCPKYPEITEIPPLWDEIVGEYELVARLPNGKIGADILGNTSIWVEDGVLQMAGFVGPLLPISETEIIILSGSFVGETMIYEPSTGYIYHQAIIYKPTDF